MNIVNKVTIRHLKENKRRTLVTIIGVIISVAMITAVSTLGASFLDLMIRQHISTDGEWHVQYKDVQKEQIKAIQEDSDTKSLALSSDSYAYLEDSANSSKPYLFFQYYNEAGMEQFPITVVDGRLPENEHEIAISKEIITNAKVDYKIGDELTVEVGERVDLSENDLLTQGYPLRRDENGLAEEIVINDNKTVTIVGMIKQPTWEPSWAPGYTVIGYVDETTITEKNPVDAFVVLDKLNGSLYDHATSLADTHGIESVNFNSDLLRYYGITKNDNLRLTLFSLAGIIMAVIIIGSVALIYNAFAISVSERARHLGMLSSVGATKKQKRNSVFFEGAVIGAISIPIGILSGIAGIGVTFLYINTYLDGALGSSVDLELVVTPASILIACVISIVTIFISTYWPARKASKISAIDAIRQTQDIKLSGKAVKTSMLVRKVFGIEAEIGLKNMKRNKKRYVATLFSLVISIVLFLSVIFFTNNIKKSLEMTQNDYQYDILIYGNGDIEKEDLAKFTTLEHVTNYTISEEASGHIETLVDEANISPQMKKLLEEEILAIEDGKYSYYVTLESLDDASFEAYAEEIGVDPNDFVGQDTPVGIVIEEISYEDGMTGKLIETKAIEAELGYTLDIKEYSYSDMEMEEPVSEFVGSIQIGALTNIVPMGVNTVGLGGINIIIPQSTMAELDVDTVPYLYLTSSDPIATQAAIEELNDLNLYVYNIHERRQQEEQMLLFMSIFIYGFITLISLISVANIFNTISTSIGLRKREFAMLRSVGMTPKGFNKMIHYESIFYGVKALAYGLPISVLVMLAIHYSVNHTFEYGFQLPWISILFVIFTIFLIVGSAMLYATAKIKKENIIDGLKQENI
ncbi:FtsX-like permease family protein [Ornithinibacillus halotolerans]|uniref:ABC transporter permease n=1 Tax=Ornithinibacillus halotolerans TaxID=1274357 RepID=A0A916SA88_9BACI|nr:FtsX-like permease family protein [Ornithinibacillus halotolerans]GGA90792.1 ABC transporter permease [Ornithinibacillus halotolerans]